ncbi:hypothetical protein BY458DRAFT_507863 [Sporodiniella umbellata]|nr:hypothetical protein BY458DRAFT_507863 [Sporodiniella umbellata]
MSVWLERSSSFLERHSMVVKLGLTALSASVLTASSLLVYQGHQRRQRARSLKEALKEAEGGLAVDLTPAGLPSGGLESEWTGGAHEAQWKELNAFLGKAGARRVREATVVVVGAGGVGSWAALMLLRAGVGRIRIIDFDQVTLSSLNRHAVACLEDVGTPKVKCIKKHFQQMAPSVQVEDCLDLLNAENVDRLLGGQPDFVVDAIDNINTKIDLIRYCYDHQLKVISSMGAGAKADPSRVQIADISETFEDPLARTVRKKLKKLNILKGVQVAYSTEKPTHVKLLPLEEEKIEDRDEFSALPDFRARILPVLGTIPSMFGMAIASHVLLHIANYAGYEPLAIKLRDGLYGRVHKEMMTREQRMFQEKVCTLDVRDVGYIFEEMWHGKSVISGPDDKLCLTRWDKQKGLDYFNAVCMTRIEANAHDALPANTDLEKHYGQEIYRRVVSRFENQRAQQAIWGQVL